MAGAGAILLSFASLLLGPLGFPAGVLLLFAPSLGSFAALALALVFFPKPGLLSHPRRWLAAWLGFVLLLYLVPLDSGFTMMAQAFIGLVGLAERANAYGRTRTAEALIGTAGGYVAFSSLILPTASGATHLAWPAILLAWTLLIGLLLLPVMRQTRWAMLIGCVPLALVSADWVQDTWTRRGAEALLVAACLGLASAVFRHLPRPSAASHVHNGLVGLQQPEA